MPSSASCPVAPRRLQRELLVAEHDPRAFMGRLGVRHRQRHRHVEVGRAAGQGRAEQRHDEPGVGRVEQGRGAVVGQRLAHRGLVGRVEPGGRQPRVAHLLDHGLGAGEVVVGHDQALDEVAPGGDGRRRAAHTADTHKEYAHWTLRVTSSAYGGSERNPRTPCG
jgi:hypothetical protein